MAEWRTQAQIDADEKLHAAVAGVLEAYDAEERSADYILSEFVVITARSGVSDRKHMNTMYNYVLANGSIPWHNMMGLMNWGRMSMEDSMCGCAVDGDDEDDGAP